MVPRCYFIQLFAQLKQEPRENVAKVPVTKFALTGTKPRSAVIAQLYNLLATSLISTDSIIQLIRTWRNSAKGFPRRLATSCYFRTGTAVGCIAILLETTMDDGDPDYDEDYGSDGGSAYGSSGGGGTGVRRGSHAWRAQAAGTRWLKSEDDMLRRAVQDMGVDNWQEIHEAVLPGRTPIQIENRWYKVLAAGLVKGKWTHEEDAAVLRAVQQAGTTDWTQVCKVVPGRSQKQVRIGAVSAALRFRLGGGPSTGGS